MFFDAPLSFSKESRLSDRINQRQAWLGRALGTTANCELIFVDPDNGLAPPSAGQHTQRGPKYTYFGDLRPITARGQSLVIYHHLDRSGTSEEQALRRVAQIREELQAERVFALKFNRVSPRFYFVVAAMRHESLLSERLDAFLSSPWKEHFTLMNTAGP